MKLREATSGNYSQACQQTGQMTHSASRKPKSTGDRSASIILPRDYYIAMERAVAKVQLEKVGVRLANVLNEAPH